MPKFIWNNFIGRTVVLSTLTTLMLTTFGSFPIKLPDGTKVMGQNLHTNHTRSRSWRRRYRRGYRRGIHRGRYPRGYRRGYRGYRGYPRRRYYNRRIIIDLSQQKLYGWEGRRLIHSFRISTGKKSTPTPRGRFRIRSKHRYNRMRGRGYDIPNVPYAMYFYRGYAIHGAFWHNRFGTPVSHGCVNLPVYQARQLFRWANRGTVVIVRR